MPTPLVAVQNHHNSCLELSQNYRECKKHFGIPQEYEIVKQVLPKLGAGSFSEVHALSNGKVVKIINARKDLPDSNAKAIQERIALEVFYLNEITKLKSDLFPKFVAFSEQPPCIECVELLEQESLSTFESIIIMTKAVGITVKECIKNNHFLNDKQSIKFFTRQLFEAEALLNRKFSLTHGDPSSTNIFWCPITHKLTVIDLGSITSLEEKVGYLQYVCSPQSLPPETTTQPEGRIDTGMVFGLSTLLFVATTGEPVAPFQIDAVSNDSGHSIQTRSAKKRKTLVKEKPAILVNSWYITLYNSLQNKGFKTEDTVSTINFFNKLLNHNPQDRYDCAATVLESPFFSEDAQAEEARAVALEDPKSD